MAYLSDVRICTTKKDLRIVKTELAQDTAISL